MAKVRGWVFTLNNPDTNAAPAHWHETGHVKWACWQREEGDAGTPHLQGYLVLKAPQRLSYMKKLNPGVHWEPRRGTHAEAKDYCTKEDTRIDGPWFCGVEPSGQGKRNDLLALKEAVDDGKTELEIAEDNDTFPVWAKYYRAVERYRRLKRAYQRSWPTQTKVYWGAPGLGKSRRALYESQDAYWLAKPNGQGGRVFFDGYDGQETVVIDEFYGWIPRDMMCRLCDRYPYLVETKGGSVPFMARTIIITSNVHPRQWWTRVGIGAMERRLQSPLGSIEEFTEEWLPPEDDSDLPATLDCADLSAAEAMEMIYGGAMSDDDDN